jgi:hypothetical protein
MATAITTLVLVIIGAGFSQVKWGTTDPGFFIAHDCLFFRQYRRPD